jgi:hypothetical protein
MNIKTKYEPYEGTLFNANNHENSRKSIFVSIVCYRDEYIVRTLDSLIRNAKNPENVFVSIVATEKAASSQPWIDQLINMYEKDKVHINLEVIDFNNKITFGELKRIADSKYNKQDYYMSVSSRSESDPHWDSILIKQFTEIEYNMGPNTVITAEPRKYLPHDEVVKGFVYFTNHKTKVSMQREEYDGSRIPICGYTEFVNDSNKGFDLSQEKVGQDISDSLIEKNNVKTSQEFLTEFHFPKFNSRKFTKDEYISLTSGFSYRFVFANAKQYFKNNSSSKVLVDENQFNFYSFINFIKNDFNIICLRFIPVYYLYEDVEYRINPIKSPSDLYESQEYINSEGSREIQRMLHNYVYKSEIFNAILSIDWEEYKFKPKSILRRNTFVDSINTFVSLYNFSTYENSLHWNKKC